MWDVWTILAVTLLSLCCLLGAVMTAVRLPGTWLIVVAAAAYGWWSDWQGVPIWLLLVLAGVALLGEVFEFLASALTARRAGGSRRAAIGGLIGGFVGMFALAIVPIPILSSVIGALLGCFIGAMVGELTVHNRMAQGTKVGFFSMLGFVIGMAAKMAIAFAMTALLLTSVVCSGPRAQVEDEPAAVEPTAWLPIEYPLDLGRAGSGPLVSDLHQLDFLVLL